MAVKYHHIIVIVGVEDEQIVSVSMGDDEYGDLYPNGSIWNPKKEQWELCVDDVDDENGDFGAEYDTPNLTNDIMASDYIWNSIKLETKN